MSNYFREPNCENAVLLMSLLGLKSLCLTTLPGSSMGGVVRGERKLSNLGRLTNFYADGTVKTFFEDRPQSEASATPRDPSQEELVRIVSHLRGLVRERLIEDLIDGRMMSHAASQDPQGD